MSGVLKRMCEPSSSQQGSSPRERGFAILNDANDYRKGFIPA
ncbi:hypothetical protein HMPREF7215_1771 [Pyramidobacter piscolens W5455]|nr:hypothetical protein HMPREF7215_1771 [Pyramidobacter piscolens W5455]